MKWIKVEDRLPDHHQVILCCLPEGFCVCIFLDTEIMNKKLRSLGIKDTGKIRFNFCSQEIRGNVTNNVTHWAELEKPE